MERSVRFWKGWGAVGVAAAFVGVLVFAVRALAGPAAPVLSFTGCLRPNGSIADVALGDQPATPCKNGQTVIHLSGGDMTAVQTPAGGGLRGGGASGDVSLSLAPIPAARVKASAPVLVPHDTLTVLPLDFVEFDTAGLFNPADNTRLTAPIDGIYTVSAHVSWPAVPVGSRELFIDAHIGFTFQRVAETQIVGIERRADPVGVHHRPAISGRLGPARGAADGGRSRERAGQRPQPDADDGLAGTEQLIRPSLSRRSNVR